MRFRLLLSPVCALLLGSCAYQGTIVQKDATPLPFTHSYGLDGSYAFLLRDSTGKTRRQVVTADVYNQYAIGEYFSEFEPRRANDGKTMNDGKTVMTAMMSKVKTATRRIASVRKPEQKRQIAKVTKAKKPEVKIAKQSRPAAQPPQVRPAVQARRALPVTPQPVELPPQILRSRPVWDNDVAYVSMPSVARCR